MNAPLIIRPENTTVIYPKHGERTIKFKVGETVEFACPQRQVVVDGTSSTSLVQATCISNTRFTVNGQRFIWSQISCSANPVARGRFLNSNCGTNARLAEIGFQLDNNRFLRTITICFDTVNQTSLYSYYDLTSSVRSSDTTTPRPNFAQDTGFYNTGNRNVNQLYVRGTQRSTINRLIGLAAKNTKYIQNGLTHFLSRGHLTARADFIYGALQNATFRYINAAPQWQGFNMNNWNQVETDTRNYAHNRNVDLQVWTGTYGVATLPDETSGEDIPLSLYVNGNKRGIPVPAIYWKIVYNPTNKRGIVLIGLNNLYEKNVSKHVICQDISNQVNWLNWRKNDIDRGYSYACTVSSFRKVVTYAPNLNVAGLLT